MLQNLVEYDILDQLGLMSFENMYMHVTLGMIQLQPMYIKCFGPPKAYLNCELVVLPYIGCV